MTAEARLNKAKRDALLALIEYEQEQVRQNLDRLRSELNAAHSQYARLAWRKLNIERSR